MPCHSRRVNFAAAQAGDRVFDELRFECVIAGVRLTAFLDSDCSRNGVFVTQLKFVSFGPKDVCSRVCQ